jgi:hypothetical protein
MKENKWVRLLAYQPRQSGIAAPELVFGGGSDFACPSALLLAIV